ncbi:MAG TPA: A/G-specific adenine glycosylase [Dokdonella sp.]|uniref:A/G-specific adenine glycosylase n=1 Tax=Dokdonella sp. TaxID=2291710 RepID=UPI002D805001|nr:A/G-specific adenine glycosylase [Dokdonella sp.]HET9034213.1 A/G-specific adenine glycosylase [Dokdonella sp.]
MDSFAKNLLAWFDIHGRNNLPWQHPRTPYRVWLSEVMLQQTQVRTVIPYFERFVRALPSLADLAAAPQDRVLALWSGLGYYSRARNLHRCAQICFAEHNGELPQSIEALSALPGIGRSTAAAILAQAHGQSHAILDGNVRRVLARFHGVQGWPGASAVQNQLWQLAESHTPDKRAADYTQAIMDLGALVCTRSKPRCAECPLHRTCVALRDGLTAALPQKKPAKTIPSRTTTMLIARDAEGRVLLERRPPTGVWARLWSLPEGVDVERPQSFFAPFDRIASPRIQVLPELIHTFSHFRLHITPILMHIDADESRIADDPDRAWVRPDELDTLGLPAPVRKLLAQH